MRYAAALVLLLGCQARAGDGASEFNGQTAFGYVERQLAFGPRVPGRPGHTGMGDWLLAELRARADTVIVQDIRHVTRGGDTLRLRNFFARFRPAAAERI
ncbi:MAG: hypothetical protein ACREME_03780, partial [Gemmatimonadales bacterium]